ncbi:CHAP domain-containing protein [Nocardia brasiliensis]|uniref:C40 family peptidase n=1 Tax=Nocardia brasiliensis TaxID=37326 RepID=UPI0024587D48|nr:CHAP domain-containing protein [Nocardia brasiliensis]
MTTTFEDIEIDLTCPAYASSGLEAVVDAAEEYMQSSIVLFASGYAGGKPDMIAWLAEHDALSKEGRALTAVGAQGLDPESSAMTDNYGAKRGAILDKTSQLRMQNDNVNGQAIASFDTSNQAFQRVRGVVNGLDMELSRPPGESELIRSPAGTLHLTAAAEIRLLNLTLAAVDRVHATIEEADSGMRGVGDDIYQRLPELPRNPYGNATDAGHAGPWTPTASSASWSRGYGTPNDIVAKAQEQLELGVSESDGDNVPVFWGADRKLYTAPYNISDAWCAAFATWTWEQAGYNVHWTNENFVPAIWNDAKSMGLASNITQAQQGDMIIFDWEGDGTPDHVGIVASVDPGTGRITTIEGNSGDQLQSQQYDMNAGSLVGVVKPPSAPSLQV